MPGLWSPSALPGNSLELSMRAASRTHHPCPGGFSMSFVEKCCGCPRLLLGKPASRVALGERKEEPPFSQGTNMVQSRWFPCFVVAS